MQYLIMFNHVDGAWAELSPEEQAAHQQFLLEFTHELAEQKNSRLIFFDPNIRPVSVRKTADGEIAAGNTPVLATGERPGGYYIIEAASMEEALEWARKGRFMIGSNLVFPITDFAV